jgi:hypothetical protein
VRNSQFYANNNGQLVQDQDGESKRKLSGGGDVPITTENVVYLRSLDDQEFLNELHS